MSEDVTKDLTPAEKLDAILARLTALEARTFDTRPIWEKALAEIAEVRAHLNRQETEMREGFGRLEREMRQLGRKLDVLNQEFLTTRADQRDLDERLGAPERKPS